MTRLLLHIARLAAMAGFATLQAASTPHAANSQETIEPKHPRRLESVAATEQLSIEHGSNTLAAVLHLPKGDGPYPVIIFIHGDGPTDRTWGGYYVPLWERFLSGGFACFAWDKPGVGASKNPAGRYVRQSYFQRASELRRAIDFLKTRGDIDQQRIGCWGISQAGWIVPMVASRSKDIAFIIAVSFPGQTAAEQVEYLCSCQILAKGGSEEQVAAFIKLARAGFAFLPRKKPADDFWRHLEGTKSDYLYDGANSSPESDSSLLIEPAELLERISCPVLAIFGTKDRNVNPTASEKTFRNAFTRSGNQHGSIQVFTNADHILCVRKKESDTKHDDKSEERPFASADLVYVPGYLDAMSTWLKNLPAAGAGEK